jgi:hypothetical protein
LGVDYIRSFTPARSSWGVEGLEVISLTPGAIQRLRQLLLAEIETIRSPFAHS